MFPTKVQIIIKGEDKTDSIFEWNEHDERIDITYSNGSTYSYNKSNVHIKHSALSNDTVRKRFEYLRRIADVVGLHDSYGGNILVNRYDKIDFLNEESMLAAFLSGRLNLQKQRKTSTGIYPFGFNISQKTAIDKALANPLVVIEGPPGTGKTQTILNIIANAVMTGKSVAVVSNNNSATANVYEKLEKYKVGFIAAYLGNSDNKTKFIESQIPLPDMSDWKLPAEIKKQIEKSLQNLYEELNIMLEEKNKLSCLRQELEAVKLEYEHFCEYCSHDEKQSLYCLRHSIPSSIILELWIACEKYIKQGKMPGLFKRFINRLFFGIVNRTFYLHRRVINKTFYFTAPDVLITICQKRWYLARIDELTENTLRLEIKLNDSNFDKKMDKYSSLSAQLFRDCLAEKYKDIRHQQFTLDDLWRNSKTFIQQYPVILSTTYSLRSSLSNKTMYDYVIIDESSQVDLVTGALALSCAENAVVVGDLKQLPNVVASEAERKTDKIFGDFDLPEAYRYKDHSLLLAIIELFPNVPRTLLREHYRCHPKIIEFCNQKFYNNQLITLTEPKSNRQPLIVYKTVEGNHARGHINQRQIDVIKNEIIPQQMLSGNTLTIGIVTPYRDQTNALQKAFSETGIQADTVDKFQGRENDIIILSTVDNEISEFTDNANRLNVAVSRAIEQLIVVISSGNNMKDKNIGDLVRYIEYNNLEVINSEIRSIFDYLYKGYREKRNMFLRSQKRISEYDSENLMYQLICDVLGSNDRFMKFDVSVHVPLRMILGNMERLNTGERQYAQNYLTHVDFLIFDKIGKIPRLVIEVDGMAFHKKGTLQAKRDKMKNDILEKYRLPYRRFKTNESDEYKRLVAVLDETVLV